MSFLDRFRKPSPMDHTSSSYGHDGVGEFGAILTQLRTLRGGDQRSHVMWENGEYAIQIVAADGGPAAQLAHTSDAHETTTVPITRNGVIPSGMAPQAVQSAVAGLNIEHRQLTQEMDASRPAINANEDLYVMGSEVDGPATGYDL